MEEPGRLQSMGSLESDTTKQLHFHALEKEMATHSSVLAWRIPGKPGGLLSMGSHRVEVLGCTLCVGPILHSRGVKCRTVLFPCPVGHAERHAENSGRSRVAAPASLGSC